MLVSNLLLHSQLFGYNLFHFTPHTFKSDTETTGYGISEKNFKTYFPYGGTRHDILAVISLGDEEAGDYTIITKEIFDRILISKRPDINTYITKRILFPQHEQDIRKEPKKKIEFESGYQLCLRLYKHCAFNFQVNILNYRIDHIIEIRDNMCINIPPIAIEYNEGGHS